MATTVTENTTTEVTELPTLETVSEVNPVDGSKIADRKALVAAGDEVISSLTAFTDATKQAGEASRRGCVANLALRRAILRGDNGAPDYAGNTAQYAFAWGTHVNRIAKANGLTEDQVNAYRTAVRRYMSDTGALRAAMAEYAAQTDDKVKTTPEQVRDLIEKREKIPADVKQGMDRLMSKQVTKNGKARLNGMDKSEIPTKFGPKPKGNGSGSRDREGTDTPNKAWSAMIADVSSGRIEMESVSENLLHLISAFVVGPNILGPVGEKIPAARKGRKVAIDTLRQIHNLLGATLAVEDGKGTKEALSEHLWNEKTEK